MALDIKDKNCANPTSMLLSAAWMLKHMGLESHSDALEKSIHKVISEQKVPSCWQSTCDTAK